METKNGGNQKGNQEWKSLAGRTEVGECTSLFWLNISTQQAATSLKPCFLTTQPGGSLANGKSEVEDSEK